MSIRSRGSLLVTCALIGVLVSSFAVQVAHAGIWCTDPGACASRSGTPANPGKCTTLPEPCVTVPGSPYATCGCANVPVPGQTHNCYCESALF